MRMGGLWLSKVGGLWRRKGGESTLSRTEGWGCVLKKWEPDCKFDRRLSSLLSKSNEDIKCFGVL